MVRDRPSVQELAVGLAYGHGDEPGSPRLSASCFGRDPSTEECARWTPPERRGRWGLGRLDASHDFPPLVICRSWRRGGSGWAPILSLRLV